MYNAKDLLIKLIEIYPIKKSKEHTDIDWLDAIKKKHALLRLTEDYLHGRLISKMEKIYPDTDVILPVGCEFNVELVNYGGQDKYIQSYVLSTGIMLGIVKDNQAPFLFELLAIYNKAGKTIRQIPSRAFRDKKTNLALAVARKELMEFYQFDI